MQKPNQIEVQNINLGQREGVGETRSGRKSKQHVNLKDYIVDLVEEEPLLTYEEAINGPVKARGCSK